MEIAEIVTILVSVGSLVLSIFSINKIKWESKKQEASAAESYEGIADRTTKRLDECQRKYDAIKDEISELRESLNLCMRILTEYSGGIDLLIKQIELNRLTPAWKPDKEKELILLEKIREQEIKHRTGQQQRQGQD